MTVGSLLEGSTYAVCLNCIRKNVLNQLLVQPPMAQRSIGFLSKRISKFSRLKRLLEDILQGRYPYFNLECRDQLFIGDGLANCLETASPRRIDCTYFAEGCLTAYLLACWIGSIVGTEIGYCIVNIANSTREGQER
jgi:hypothetical protein